MDQDLNPELENTAEVPEGEGVNIYKTLHLPGMYQNWFLDYASYVILERAVPELLDGLKPVQRRILHAMKQMDDGRFHKVANIIGQTMQYHPHGDASIGDALVQLGQKDLLIDTQGNWGNIFTGDSAAAPRYIEARLSHFALEVLFNPKITPWKSSYDGRKKEPVYLPVKFPLLLAMGVEGIAVGLASKVLPHNFIELIDASIATLKGEEYQLYPDFATGGMVDVSRYNQGRRGGKIRIRARIQQLDKKTLVVREIPFSTNTTSLIDTIIAANEKGKIRIRKIDDNTAENVEILIHLLPGVSPDTTMDALYAFTDCEISISPNCCVIHQGKPEFTSVDRILTISTGYTLELIRKELEIKLSELRDQWHFASLEKIFIEKKVYRKIEQCVTWEEVLDAIDKGLAPYTRQLMRQPDHDDIIRLTEIRIKRISRFDAFKADENLLSLEGQIEEVNNNLSNLVAYAISYFQGIRDKYGKGHERKTEIRSFEIIEAQSVAAATLKLYINRADGFAGTSLKKDEFVCECSDLDDMILFRSDGTFLVTRVAEKFFVGEGVVHIDVFRKNDDRTVYNLIYKEGGLGPARAKRFSVIGVTRDKEYNIASDKKGTRVLYFSANPNGEAEVVKIQLKPKPRLKKLNFDFDFSSIEIKGRSSRGNLVSKNPVRKVLKKEEGVSTLGAIGIYYDDTVKRLNTEGRGKFIGDFMGDENIVVFTNSGFYRVANYDLSNHFEDDLLHIRKFDPAEVISAIYQDGDTGHYYLKRFLCEKVEKAVSFCGDPKNSKFVEISFEPLASVMLTIQKKLKGQGPENETVDAVSFIGVKGYKAKGKRLSQHQVLSAGFVAAEPVQEDSGSLMVDNGNSSEEQWNPEEGSIPADVPEVETGLSENTLIEPPSGYEILQDDVELTPEHPSETPVQLTSPKRGRKKKERPAEDGGEDQPPAGQMTLF